MGACVSSTSASEQQLHRYLEQNVPNGKERHAILARLNTVRVIDMDPASIPEFVASFEAYNPGYCSVCDTTVERLTSHLMAVERWRRHV